MRTLRADQATGIDRLRDALTRTRRVVFKAPCGFGKTVVAADIVERVRERNKRAMITVPAISLIDQTVESFYAHGIRDIGVIQANHVMTDWSKPVQVASIDTLRSRGEMPECDLAIIDEAHKWFDFYEKWFTDPAWERRPIIGMSATPWTRGLGAYYHELVIGNTIAAMVRDGLLSDFKVFAPVHPDLCGVRTTAGDYNQKDLGEAMNRAKLVADIIETWNALGRGRPTVCFAVDRAHAEHIAQRFAAAGVASGYMDCETPLGERKAIRERLKRGEVQVVCNVDVVGIGVDWPELSCAIYARPTKSEMRLVQNVGRVLRKHPGKDYAVIIDHSDTHLRLGKVTDLDAALVELNDGKARATAERNIPLPKECPNCSFLKPPRSATCPNCGHKSEQHAREVEEEDKKGRLEEFTGRKRSPAAELFPDQRQTYCMLLGYALSRGKKPGMAFFKYKELYGKEPYATRSAEPIEPSPELLSWIKSQNIRYAKSKARQDRVNGHGNGALTDREQALINGVRDRYVGGTLCTEEELSEFGGVP